MERCRFHQSQIIARDAADIRDSYEDIRLCFFFLGCVACRSFLAGFSITGIVFAPLLGWPQPARVLMRSATAFPASTCPTDQITLAEVKGKAREVPQPRERSNGSSRPSNDGGQQRERAAQQAAAVQVRKRVPPPNETNAEIFYYKKQIDAHTQMVILLLDGEEIEGTIEWYDRGALKVNRKSAPNLLVLKRNIKYMYKADERVEKSAD
jgi:sRNA-binding regulator protein Hfq